MKKLKKPSCNSLSKCPIKMVYFLGHFVSLLRKFFCNNKLSKMCFFKRIWAYILLFEVRNSVGLVINRYFEWLMPKKKTKILWDISRGYYGQVFWAILKKISFLLRIWVYILFIVVWFEKKNSKFYFEFFFSIIPPHYDSKNKNFQKKFFFSNLTSLS